MKLPHSSNSKGLMNALTIDVEDYFQVSALAPHFPKEVWNATPCRVERNVDRILEMLVQHGARGTFFTLGWIAERYPELVRRIANEGHELASHGYAHERASSQSPEAFLADIRLAKVVLEDIYRFLITNYYYGIGEIGMDLYWDKTTYENQYDAFRIQAKWAIERNLPVSIHSRDATQELIDLIVKEELNELRGVFHCFTGDETQARTIINMGFYLGIGGVVTYKNSTLPGVLEKVGIEHLVLETDAPYLPPVPHRGKRNEPSYIPLIAEKLALIFNLSLAEVAEITTNNSRKVFGI